jgi:RNA polymerase sigma-70 factor, ECF subfamily
MEDRAQQGRADHDPQRDARLVAQALAGDLTAFDQLVNLHQRKAVAVAGRLLGNLQDALEVAQEAFLRAYRSLNTLQTPERFGPWLMRIVSNLALNFRRSRKTSAALPLEDLLATSGQSFEPVRSGSSPESPVDAASTGELRQVVQQAIAELPEKQRTALVLFAIEGMPQKEVAEILGCSLEVVKWSVFQARKTLKVKLAMYLAD